jgi:hypothetical protein
MNVQELVRQARLSGVEFEVIGDDQIEIVAAEDDLALWLSLLKPHRQEIAALLRTNPRRDWYTPGIRDDRRRCNACAELGQDGRCNAAKEGRISGAARIYHPVQDILRRCDAFADRGNGDDGNEQSTHVVH